MSPDLTAGPEVIGLGFGRTGTTSLAAALEQLGFAPCYKEEALEEHAACWLGVVDGADADLGTLLGPYRSLVDWPGALLWPRLTDAHPDARLILTVRDADAWYDSMVRTFEPLLSTGCESDDSAQRDACSIWYELAIERLFDGRFHDRDHAVDVYRQHNAAVRAAYGGDRLLEYRPGDGWEPLCGFLDRPVPDAPYPQVNSRESLIESIVQEMHAST